MKTKNKRIFMTIIFSVLLLLPAISLAQNTSGYQLLAPLPEFGSEYTPGNFSNYVNTFIKLSLVVAAVLAVVKIVIGGFKYMTSESLHLKQAGEDDIKGAVLGLVILTASFLILNTINPSILSFRLDIAQINVPVSQNQNSRSGAPIPTRDQTDAQATDFDTTTVPPEKMSPAEAGGQRGNTYRARCAAAGRSIGGTGTADFDSKNGGQMVCFIDTKANPSSGNPSGASGSFNGGASGEF